MRRRLFFKIVVLCVVSYSLLGKDSKENFSSISLRRKIDLTEVIPNEGGFSGLYAEKKFENRSVAKFEIWILTDRGPNGEKTDLNEDGIPERVFFYPNYIPKIFQLELSIRKSFELISIELLDIIELSKNGVGLSGRPNLPFVNQLFAFDEVPLSSTLELLNYDSHGVDPESIVKIQNDFWIGEEYGPSILNLNEFGEVKNRYIPKTKGGEIYKRDGVESLPYHYGKRRLNRGFEAFAYNPKSGLIYSFLQSPIETIPIEKEFRLVRVLVFDTKSKRTLRTCFYPLSKKGKKLGGGSFKDDSIFVIEQSRKSIKKVYKTNTCDFDGQILEKENFLDMAKFGLEKYEKIEGLFFLENYLFVINDNDYKNLPLRKGMVPKFEQSGNTRSHLFIFQ